MIIVTSYRNPDLDGVGGIIGYAEFLRSQGKEAEAAIYGNPFVEAQWVLDTFNITPPKQMSEFDLQHSDIVLIDTSYTAYIDPEIPLEKVTEIIDHRKDGNVESFPNAKIQIELIGAAAALVAERIRQSGGQPSPEAALVLLGGILSNTQNFSSSNTTDRDHAMYDWLATIAKPPVDFSENMFQAKTRWIFDNLGEAMRADGLAIVLHGMPLTQTQIEIVGAAEFLGARMDDVREVLRQMKQEGGGRYLLLNCIDIGAKTTDIIVLDQESEDFYGSALQKLGVRFRDGRAHLDHILLRKQIVPSIKDAILKLQQ